MNNNNTATSNIRLKLKMIAVSILALCIIGASILFFALSAGEPFIGVSLTWDNQGWKVEELDPNGLAFHAGIQTGDRPLEIDGQPAELFLKDHQRTDTTYFIFVKEITVSDANGQIKR